MYRTTRHMVSRLAGAAASLALFLLLAAPATAADINVHIDGCEARDMTQMLGAGATGSWRGQTRQRGPLSFTSEANVECRGGVCRVGTGLDARGIDGKALPADGASIARYVLEPDGAVTIEGYAVVLSTGANASQSIRRIEGDAARNVAAAMGAGAFIDERGWRREVLVDYGDMSGITVRARTSLACAMDADSCEVLAENLVFVSYNERHACGSFSESAPRTVVMF